MAEAVERSPTAIGLNTISALIRRWLDWSRESRSRENLKTDDGTSIMALPVTFWPSHGQFKAWIDLFEKTAIAYDEMLSERAQLVAELSWYGEQARLARLIHSEGDAGRQALAADGGKRAAAVLETQSAAVLRSQGT